MNTKVFQIEESSSVQSYKKQEDTAKRFVAFLDIMGFKDRVARTDHNELREQLIGFNAGIIQHTRQYDNRIQWALFSDSIVLFSNDDSLDSLKNIAEVTCSIMRDAISRQIPVKGAIAQGIITCDVAKQLFFGQALIDAYLLEENIHYYGILAHHSAEQSVIRLDKKSGNSYFRDIKAPLKSGQIGHYELSWYADSEKDTETLRKTCSGLRNIRETVSDAPRKYIDNTLEVIDKFYKSKKKCN